MVVASIKKPPSSSEAEWRPDHSIFLQPRVGWTRTFKIAQRTMHSKSAPKKGADRSAPLYPIKPGNYFDFSFSRLAKSHSSRMATTTEKYQMTPPGKGIFAAPTLT